MQHSPAWALAARALLREAVGRPWDLGSECWAGRLLGHSGAWASYQEIAVPSHPFSLLHPQLPVHAELLPVMFPAAGLGGVCVCDLRLCEGESPSHATQRASSQWPRPLLTPEHHTRPREWTW